MKFGRPKMIEDVPEALRMKCRIVRDKDGTFSRGMKIDSREAFKIMAWQAFSDLMDRRLGLGFHQDGTVSCNCKNYRDIFEVWKEHYE